MNTGKVILTGAGPGHPDLITVMAARYLQQADVIICDRLVSNELLERYASTDALIIHSGKEGHSSCSAAQYDINSLLLEHYDPCKLLVRLKGGDTAFFSNILDELKTLSEHEIPFEIVPGITAASGASSFAGIPLTARGYADSVRFLTSYKHGGQDYWKELAATKDTLVFYMSGSQLPYLLEQLHAHGLSEDKEIAVIEQATTPYQNVSVFKINEINSIRFRFRSPTLIVIGRVVALHRQFSWKENTASEKVYFRPAEGIIVEQPLLA